MEHDISITIKPTHSCNFTCKHCFNGEKLHDRTFLPVSSASHFIKLVAKEYKDIGLTFHGGEPALASVDFYREVYFLQKILSAQCGTTFSNNFTTNGSCLSEQLIDLLVENNVLINVSFDGPHNNDLRENTDHVYKQLCDLKRRGARFRVYCVETAMSTANLIHTYQWFRDEKIDYKIIPLQPYGNAKHKDDIILNIPHFVEELMNLYRYWLTDKTCEIRVFTLEEFLSFDPNSAFKAHWYFRKLALNPDGKLYPFGRPNDVNFCLGDAIALTNITGCFETYEYKRIISTLEQCIAALCIDCRSFPVCGGITIASTFVYSDDYDMMKYSCLLADKIFTTALSINQEVMQDIQNGHAERYANKVQQRFANISALSQCMSQ